MIALGGKHGAKKLPLYETRKATKETGSRGRVSGTSCKGSAKDAIPANLNYEKMIPELQ
jgi:hypothetical protein